MDSIVPCIILFRNCKVGEWLAAGYLSAQFLLQMGFSAQTVSETTLPPVPRA